MSESPGRRHRRVQRPGAPGTDPEPRVEPRVWTFGLRKTGDEWQIETARAER